MTVKNLIKDWTLPDRTNERTQMTLRVDFTSYAKLHALKEVFPSRSVNDLINDILKNGLDEIIDALPSQELTEYEALEQGFVDDFNQPIKGVIAGFRVSFDNAYRSILNLKSSDEAVNNA